MAEGNDNSIASLYLELGLDISQLESDLITADQTVRQNLSRLQNESTLIRLRSNVEINGLDEAADATRILEIREEALNRQMEIQRDRIRVTEAALQDLTNRRGAEAQETQRTAIRLERERLALQRLQRELNGLRNTDAPENIADRYSNAGERIRGTLSDISGNAENFTSGLNGALETSLELIDRIPTGYGKAIAAMVAATAAVPVMEFAIAGMARTAVDRFNEIEEKAYELHMTFEDTYKYLNLLEMAHAESDDIMGFIRGIDDAIAKGDVDDPETMALQKFGVVLQDKTGRFLTYDEQLKNLYEGYKRAKEVGEEVEYLLFLNGESIHEILPLFERWEESEKDIAKVEWADYNVAAMHEATREMKLLDNQVNEFGYSVSAAITPAARMAINDLFEKFHDATKWVNENKDAIAYWGFVARETFNTVSGKIGALKEKFQELTSPELNFNDWEQNGEWNEIQGKMDKFNEDSPLNIAKNFLSEYLFGGIKERAKEAQDAYNETVDELKDKTEELNKQWESNPLSYALRDSLQRAADLRDELEDLNLEIDFDEDEFGLSLAQVDTWIKRELKNAVRLTQGLEKSYQEAVADGNEDMVKLLAGKMKVAKQEETELYALAAAKAEKIEQDKEHALEDIRDEAEANFKTDLENQIKAIEDKKDDWIHAGMEEAEATILAEKLKADAIEELEKEFSDKLNELRQNDLEKQLARFDKEKDALIDKGIDEARAEEYAAEARGKFLDEYRTNLEKEAKNATENLDAAAEQIQQLEEQRAQAIQQFNNDVARDVDSIWHTELENRLADIEREKQAWIDKGLDEVKATEQAEQAKADARRNAAMSVLKSELKEYRAFQQGGYEGLRDYQLKQLYKSGIKPEDLQMTPQQLQSFQRAQMIAQNSLMPNMMSSMDKELAARAKWNLPNDRFSTLMPSALELPNIGNLNAIVGDLDKQIVKAVQGYAEAAEAVADVAAKFKELSSVMGDGQQPQITQPEQSTIEISNLIQPVTDVTDKFVAMSPPIEDVTNKIVDLGTTIENIPKIEPAVETPDLAVDTSQIFSAFEELVSPMNEVNAQFGEMSGKLLEVTSGLSELVGALNQLQTQPQAQQQPQVVTPPPNITVTVQIDEAHAWDSQHIQELADKVANVIEPELISAIGGDSNRY